ncbi:probable cytochrome P450 9f2 [Culicoides brevitarsis]|uniref:probable cytochrome P450 9f2 n=1 Tax=Culicoides brevitarsis TaxID=469753 RepID=UPI00307B8E75
MELILSIIFFLTLFFALYKYLTFNFNYFRDHNVPHKKPVPFFGNQFKFFAKKQSIPDFLLDIGNEFRDEAYVGFYECRTPTLFILSPDAIKQICIKNFDNFVNHPAFSESETDDLLLSSVFFMKDQRWRDMRGTLSPAFTGSKMRIMFDLVRDCAENLVSYCNEKCQENNGLMTFRPKDLFSKVSMDIICTCAFGLQNDSLRNPQNQLYQMFSRIMDMTGIKTVLKFFVMILSKDLANWLGVSFLPNDTSNFIKKLVSDTISYRKKTQEYRPDVIQLLIEAMEGKLKHEDNTKNDDESFAIVKESEIDKKGGRRDWSDVEIAAQCFIFLIGGFDTTSNLFNFISYQLAVDPEIQEQLYEEVRETQTRLNGAPVTYDDIQKMQYLDAFICECLRKYPPMLQIDRICNKETVIHDGKGNSFKIPIGMKVNMNPFATHYNPKYFPNPEKFDPQRFLGENKKKIDPYSFISFGVGPRACVGSRFAMMQTKLILYHVVANFAFEVTEKTGIPMRFVKEFRLEPERPIVGLRKRSS